MVEERGQLDTFAVPLEELKKQTALLQQILSEIAQLRTVMVASARLPMSPQHLMDISSTNPLPKPSEGLSDGPLARLRDLGLPRDMPSQIQFPELDKLKRSITKPQLQTLKKLQEKLKLDFERISGAVAGEEFSQIISLSARFFETLLLALTIMLKPSLLPPNIPKERLADYSRDLGPTPVIIEFDAVDFISSQKDNSVGRKTSERLFKHITQSMTSFEEMLSIVL